MQDVPDVLHVSGEPHYCGEYHLIRTCRCERQPVWYSKEHPELTLFMNSGFWNIGQVTTVNDFRGTTLTMSNRPALVRSHHRVLCGELPFELSGGWLKWDNERCSGRWLRDHLCEVSASEMPRKVLTVDVGPRRSDRRATITFTNMGGDAVAVLRAPVDGTAVSRLLEAAAEQTQTAASCLSLVMRDGSCLSEKDSGRLLADFLRESGSEGSAP